VSDARRTPALAALLAAEAAHAALCVPGTDEGVLRRAYIAALEANRAYFVECSESPDAIAQIEAHIADERRALGALDARRAHLAPCRYHDGHGCTCGARP
jgi:hypothetical protein